MSESKNYNLLWLLAAAAVVFYFWQSDNVPSQAQKELANCQAEFKAFKDGLTYGR